MNIRLKRIILSIVFCSILFFSFNIVSNILEDKSSEGVYNTYLKICDDIDIEFLGASRIVWQVYPLNLWDDYGITSYNTAVSGSRPQCWYWIMRETLKYHKPKIIVLDVSLLSRNEQANNEAMISKIFDAFPLDLTKIEGALDFKAENVEDYNYNPWNIIFNIRKYHDRWNDLTAMDFNQGDSNSFNTVRAKDIGEMEFDFSVIDRDRVTEQYTISMYYVEECVKLAKKNDVEILLIQTPNPHLEESQEIYNWCYSLVEQYGIQYWNMNEDVSYLNFKTDKSTNEYIGRTEDFQCGIYETGIHLNVSGANKLTAKLGEYLIENYGLKDHRGDSRYDYWNDYLNDWNSNKFNELNGQEVFANYLMLLADEHYDVFIKVNNEMELTELEKNLFKNIGINPEKIMAGAYIFEGNRGEEVSYYYNDNSEVLTFNNMKYDIQEANMYYQGNIYDFGRQEGQESPPNIQFFIVHDEDLSLINYSNY